MSQVSVPQYTTNMYFFFVCTEACYKYMVAATVSDDK